MSSILSILFVLLWCHCHVYAEKKACTKFPETPEPTALSLLRKKLKCNYDIETPPLNASNTRIKLQLYMQAGKRQFHVNSEYASLPSYFLLVWTDNRLKWNEAEHKNHSNVYLKVSDIWSPTIIDLGTGFFRHPRYVLVFSSGQVHYLLWWEVNGHCRPTYAKWTDKRICSVSFQLEPADKLLVRDHYMLGSTIAEVDTSWSVVDVTEMKHERISSGNLTDPIPFISKIDTTLGMITLELHLQRNTAIMDATIFSPAAVLLLLTLASTWIPCSCSIRLALLALTTLLEIFLMHLATRAVPTLPGRFSDFAVMYRDLIMVSGAAFFEWYVAYLVACKKISSSGRLQSLAGAASQSSYTLARAVLLIPSNPFKVQNGTSEGAFLSIILDRITFLILLIVYVTVMVITAHRPIPND